MKMNTQQPKTYGTQQRSPEMEVHSITGLPKEGRKISNKQPNPTPKRTSKISPKVSGRKEITSQQN